MRVAHSVFGEAEFPSSLAIGVPAKRLVCDEAYEEATRKRFGEVIDGTVQPAITKSTTLITNRLERWAEGVLDQQLTKMSGTVNRTLTSVTRDFRARLYGAWSGLLWAMLGGGVIAGLIMFMAGYYLGKQ